MKKRLKFIDEARYNGEVVYKEGDVVDIENELGMADRWIKRAKAIEVAQDGTTKAQAVAKPAVAAGKPAEGKPSVDNKNPAGNNKENDL